MVKRAALFLVSLLCMGGYGLAPPTHAAAADLPPETASGAKQRPGEPALEGQFASYICGSVPECGTRDISDRALDYGAWLAARLGVKALARLPVVGSFYVEAGPRQDGSSLSLGLVSYRSTDAARTRAIFTALQNIPEGAFKDGMVIMRFQPRVERDRIDIFFTDSFDRAFDRFMEML